MNKPARLGEQPHPFLVALTALLVLVCANLQAAEESATTQAQIKSALYVKFHPVFIVNLSADTPRFLMVTIQGMSRDEDGINAAKHHMAAIRHGILMLLSEQTVDSVKSVDDKKRLMTEALKLTREVLVAETGQAGIEAVLFTDFVIE